MVNYDTWRESPYQKASLKAETDQELLDSAIEDSNNLDLMIDAVIDAVTESKNAELVKSFFKELSEAGKTEKTDQELIQNEISKRLEV